MKRGVFFTLNFKGLFSGVLVGCLVFSFVLAISFGFSAKNTGTLADKSMNSTTLKAGKTPLIIIDPGHGGEDGGTASSKGVNEKNINLDISQKLSELFQLAGYDVLMTRTEDKLIYDGSPSTMREKKVSDIKKRMEILNNNPNSIFLSIHQNYFTVSKYWGAQVFYSGNDADSKIVAQSIQDSIVNKIQSDNTRKIKQSGEEIYLLYHAKTPAVMVECGFMSNPSEALLLSDAEYQTRMAVAILDGVNNYLKIREGEV